MSGQYLTRAESAALLAVFVLLPVTAGMFVQYLILKRSKADRWMRMGIICLAAPLAIACSWGMLLLALSVGAPLASLGLGYGGILIIPVITATSLVTLAVYAYARTLKRRTDREAS